MKSYPAQAEAHDMILDSVSKEAPGCYFLDGPGGAGKTYLYETLLHAVRGRGKIALACAWSGIAATLLPGGRTCHSRFGLPVPMPTEDVCSSIKFNSARAKILRDAAILLWDEAPMAPCEALDAVDRLLQDLMENDLPFGGKVLVLGGDFRQVLPVMPHCGREVIVEHALNRHPLWLAGQVRVVHLDQNRRALTDPEWQKFLMDVGNGEVPTHSTLSPWAVQLPAAICAPADWTLDTLISDTFPGLLDATAEALAANRHPSKLEYFCRRAILAPTNAVVDSVNARILTTFPKTETTTYYSVDSADAASEAEASLWPVEFLNSLCPTGLPPHNLTLCPGAIVMLLRNLDAKAGLVNGARALVIQTLPHVLDVMLLSGAHSGHRVYIPRIALAPSNPELPFVLRRRQFPVKLAWSMTINKAQGQTLARVGLYLASAVFAHGQLYVALSRVGACSGIKVLVNSSDSQGHFANDDRLQDGCYTDNVVWPEVLLAASIAGAAMGATRGSSSTPKGDASDDDQDMTSPKSAPAAPQVVAPPAPRRAPEETSECYDSVSGPQTLFPDILPPQRSSVADMVTPPDHGPDPSEAHLATEHCESTARPNLQRFDPVHAAAWDAQIGHDLGEGAQIPEERVQVPRHRYFERQHQAECGLHALNNAGGGPLFASEHMESACAAFLQEHAFEGLPERESDHIRPGGWYSAEVLAYVCRWWVAQNDMGNWAHFTLEVNDPVQPTPASVARMKNRDSLGLVVNKDNQHWVAFRYENDGSLWLLDSQGDPEVVNETYLIKFLQRYRWGLSP